MNKNKVIFDVIHGFIEVDDITLSIIDTPEFQRLRNIKQLGVVHYVFPSANHTRFEHSLGVYYLAGELISNLKKNQPELEIKEKEIFLVKIAGLCHDLGHGPFSHLLDTILECSNKNKFIIHERRSILILEHIVNKYNIDLSEEDIKFIGDLINPYDLDFSKIDKNKHFLYEIVSNRRNGIDVDKFDYLKRDTFYLGLSFSLDCSRIIKYVRVIDGKLSYLDKTYYHILEMYEIRNKLHRQIYKHKTIIGIELSIKDIITKYLDLGNLLEDPGIFCQYDDNNIFMNINNVNDNKINNNKNNSIQINKLLEKINRREIYKLEIETNEGLINYNFHNKVLKIFNFGYKESPFKDIYFYNRNDLYKNFNIIKDNLDKTKETVYRVYTKY
jgi:deoxynucleoside triphosphate triphosphohydrolase SAMHD1